MAGPILETAGWNTILIDSNKNKKQKIESLIADIKKKLEAFKPADAEEKKRLLHLEPAILEIIQREIEARPITSPTDSAKEDDVSLLGASPLAVINSLVDQLNTFLQSERINVTFQVGDSASVPATAMALRTAVMRRDSDYCPPCVVQ